MNGSSEFVKLLRDQQQHGHIDTASKGARMKRGFLFITTIFIYPAMACAAGAKCVQRICHLR